MINQDDALKAGFGTIDSAQKLPKEKMEKIKQIKSILPALVNGDGLVDVSALKDFLGIENFASLNQGYALNFAGKGLAKIKADEPTKKGLKVEETQSKNFDDAGNVIIRGDNLDVLKILRQNYTGKVKMIYIDPPYNTDSASFVYADNFRVNEAELIERFGIEEEAVNFLASMFGSQTHSGWLFAMYPRLKLARDLLADNGMIFISIDDHEQANLKLLCDEIFGAENMVATLHVEMSTTQGMKVAAAKEGKIVKNAEYVLLYAKDNASGAELNLLYEAREWDYHYSVYYDKQRNERTTLLQKIRQVVNSSLLNIDDTQEFKNSDIAVLYVDNAQVREFIHANADKIYQDAVCDRTFNLDDSQQAHLDAGEIVTVPVKEREYVIFKNQNGNVRQLLNLQMALGHTDGFSPHYGLRRIRGNWWKDYYKDMMNVGKEGGVEYKNGKKPIRLLRDMLKIIGGDDYLVLDFFAGSGTTAEAVMRLNAEDGGNRKFILVQWDESIDEQKSPQSHQFCIDNKLAPVISSITIERVNRAGEQLQSQNGKLGHALDIGYKVFSLTDRPTLEETEDGQLQLQINWATTSDLLYNMMAMSGEVLLTDNIEEVEANLLYKVGNSYYVLGECQTPLEQYASHRIYINGYADIRLEQWLNMLGLNKENVKVLY